MPGARGGPQRRADVADGQARTGYQDHRRLPTRTRAAIQAACHRFVLLCRQLGLIAGGTVAVDGSRFRAVNARDRNFTPVTIRRRMDQVDASIQRYLGILDTAGKRRGCPRFLENATRSDLLPKIMPLGNLLVRWRRVMQRGRFAGDWIIGVLREYEAGVKTAELCRKHGISDATFYNWKAKYGGMTVSEAARLRALEDENRRLNDLLGTN